MLIPFAILVYGPFWWLVCLSCLVDWFREEPNVTDLDGYPVVYVNVLHMISRSSWIKLRWKILSSTAEKNQLHIFQSGCSILNHQFRVVMFNSMMLKDCLVNCAYTNLAISKSVLPSFHLLNLHLFMCHGKHGKIFWEHKLKVYGNKVSLKFRTNKNQG